MAKKIVIVEDNTALAEIYKTRLELVGYACYAAYDGVEALEVIERTVPDLVLLDLMVPRIAGDEILRRMRESNWGKGIKVYIISNLNEADAPKGLRQMGIEGYAVKANLTNDELDRTVDSILNKVGQSPDVSLEMSPPVATQNIPVAAPPSQIMTPEPVMQMPSPTAPIIQPIAPAPEPPVVSASALPVTPVVPTAPSTAPHAQEYHQTVAPSDRPAPTA